MNRNIIGDRLYHLRIEAGFTMAKFAEKINKSEGHVSVLESGASFPSIQTLLDICNLYNITISEFFNDNGMLIDLTHEQRKLINLSSDLRKEQIDYLNDFIQSFFTEKEDNK